MKRFLLATAALAAAVVVFTFVELPPRPLALDASWSDGTVPGVLHIHTNRSDGLSTPDDIAAAAAQAGLKFLVFTDHGDATRAPDPPAYRSGVLCLDGVEISTSGGHYIAIGMGPAPYPLAGESRDVVEDVQRLGGFGIAAHPDSPKAELRWTDWDTPIDGLELINPDTSWRVHMAQGGTKFALFRALFTYAVRPSETIGSLLPVHPRSVNNGIVFCRGVASWGWPASMRTRNSCCSMTTPATVVMRCPYPATNHRSASYQFTSDRPRP